MGAHLPEAASPPDLQLLDDRGLGQIVRREYHCRTPGGPGRQGNGQGTPDRAKVALQADLSQNHGIFEFSVRYLAARHQEAQCDRQIQSGTILAYVRGSQIDGDPPQRKSKAGVREGRRHALTPLLYRTVRKPDGGERRQAAADVDLDFDRLGVDTQNGGGSDSGEHDRSVVKVPPS
jgi:hypothetical protein